MSEPALIVLAAGKSQRFGSNKLLATISPSKQEQAVIQATWQSLKPLGIAPSLWIAEDNDALKQRLHSEEIPFHTAQTCREGIGSTLAEAVRFHHNAAGWIICLADMPCIQPSTLLEIRRAMTFKSIVRPQYRGINGHPVAFGQAYYPQLIQITGDRGARDVVANHPTEVIQLQTEDEGVLVDIDTTSDLTRVNQLFAERQRD